MTIVDLAYDVQGSGPLAVALHGITDNRHSRDPVPLAEHFRTIRVDLRGHGASPDGPPFDVVTLARDVHAVVRRDAGGGGQTPILIGHSMGGVVATSTPPGCAR